MNEEAQATHSRQGATSVSKLPPCESENHRVILIELTVSKHTRAVASQDSLLTDPRNWGWGYGREAMSWEGQTSIQVTSEQELEQGSKHLFYDSWGSDHLLRA